MKRFLVPRMAVLAAIGGIPGSGGAMPADASVFRCSPERVASGDTIVLAKGPYPALRELAVRRPGSRAPHLLVVQRPPRGLRPFMAADELAATREVRIPVARLTGLEWRAGAIQEPVFTVPGIYEFVLGTVIESDEPGYTCRVDYRP